MPPVAGCHKHPHDKQQRRQSDYSRGDRRAIPTVTPGSAAVAAVPSPPADEPVARPYHHGGCHRQRNTNSSRLIHRSARSKEGDHLNDGNAASQNKSPDVPDGCAVR